MKIAAISDLHFHNWNAFSKIEDGVNSRLLNIEKAVTEAYDIALDNDCQYMCIPGDIFHVRGTVKVPVANRVINLFHSFEDIKTLVISGNHDLTNSEYDPEGTAVNFLSACRNVMILDNEREYFYDRKTEFIGVPYHHNIDSFKEAFVKVIQERTTANPIILIHQGIDDFRPSLSVPETKLTASWFKSVFDENDCIPIVLCGHYHKPMHNEFIINVGSPLQHTFGGAGQERGVWIIDTDSREFKKVPINSVPKFYTLDEDELSKIKNLSEFVANNYVKIKTKSIKAVEKIAKKGGIEISEIMVDLDKEFRGSYETKISIDSVDVMLGQYLKEVLDIGEHDVNRIVGSFKSKFIGRSVK